jgi:Coenzyme PQQ synthesis protein D (PqqD)
MESDRSEPLQSDAIRVTDDARLEPNEAEVAAKVYDDEVVFMHLTTGVYGSIEHLGAIVWQAVEQRHSVREIAELLATRYEVSAAQALGDVRELAAQLLREGMVRPSAAVTASDAAATAGTRHAYQRPELVVYRDMEDLLALDPPLPQYAEAPWKKS